MKNTHHMRIPVIAFTLIVVGLFGLAVGPVIIQNFGVVGGRFASGGQRIYNTGSDAIGPIPRTIGGGNCGTAAGAACVDCHGTDGRGGRTFPLASFTSPDIRYSTLTAPHTRDGTSTPGWTETDITRAIRDGIDPSGQPLRIPMPRWSMTDADLTDTIAYLKELSPR